MIELQVTLYSDKGRRPLSTLVKVDSMQEYNANKTKIQLQAVQAICAKRYMTGADLRKYGYTGIRVRVYDREKIKQENTARYEQIKKERGWA